MSENSDHRRHRHKDRGQRDNDRHKHSKSKERPFSSRNYDHRQHDNNRKPIHTVFLFNINFKTPSEQIVEFAKEFGEVQMFYQPPSRKGMAFITYYDIRDAINMVDKGYGRELNGNTIKTAYAYQPPKYSKRDPRDICGSTTFELESKNSRLTIDDIRAVAEKFGAIRSLVDVGKGIFDIVFFDLRAAKNAVDQKEIEIKGEKVVIDYNLSEGIGEEPVLLESKEPKERQRDSDSSKREKSRKSQSESPNPPFPYPIQYPFPYPIQYPFPPYAQFAFPNNSNTPQIPLSGPTAASAPLPGYPPFPPMYNPLSNQATMPLQPNNPSMPPSFQQPALSNSSQSLMQPQLNPAHGMISNPFKDDSSH